MTADEIHALGLAEVERIHAQMEVIKRQVGFNGTLQQFFASLRDDPKFLFPNTDEGREGYLQASRDFYAAIEAKLPEYFGLLPKAGLIVKTRRGLPRATGRGAALRARDSRRVETRHVLRASDRYELDAENRDGKCRVSRRHPGPPHAGVDRAGAHWVAEVPHAGIPHGVCGGLGSVCRTAREGDGRLPGSVLRLRAAGRRDLARDSTRRRHRFALEGLDRATGRRLLPRERSRHRKARSAPRSSGTS